MSVASLVGVDTSSCTRKVLAPCFFIVVETGEDVARGEGGGGKLGKGGGEMGKSGL